MFCAGGNYAFLFMDFLQTVERTRCGFIDDEMPTRIESLLPTGTPVSKTGAPTLRIQTPVFTGNVTFGSCVGLSPHLGRVYLNETRKSGYQRTVNISEWLA